MQTLVVNRKNHRAMFEAAVAGYRDAVIMELDKMLLDAKKGRRIRREVQLNEPIDQTAEYDKIIRQLEMEVRDEVELSDEEFNNYVMDNWRWKGAVMALAGTYADEGEAMMDHDGLTRTSWSPKKFH